MSPAVYRTFHEICAAVEIRGAVLEVGAVPGPASLLRLPALQGAARRVGISLAPPCTDAGAEILQGNANDMRLFADGLFAAVVCNATLEHDPFFWKTLAEIRRVTAPGGLIVIGVPGFGGMGPDTFLAPGSRLRRPLRWLARVLRSDVLQAGAVTLGEHNYPGDYYRFTEQAVREVFLATLRDPAVRRVMNPPRFIGSGWKP
jgi:SAM-dependent methyltransferase